MALKKSLSHIVDNFFLRQEKHIGVPVEKHFDERFTTVSEDCARFSLIECGPGQLRSRHFFSFNGETIASLSYSRLEENWSECLTKTTTGDYVVVVTYHCNVGNPTIAVIRKYRTVAESSNVKSSERFFCRISDLDSQYSTVSSTDLLASRVVVLSGNLDNCYISLIKEGFDHN